MKLSFEISPTKFLDTKLNCVYRIYKTMVQRKTTKLRILQSSKYLKISTQKSITPQTHGRILESSLHITIHYRERPHQTKKRFEKFIYYSTLFIQKPFILIELPFSNGNQNKSEDFNKTSTNNKFKISIISISKKRRRFCSLKKKKMYPSGKTYQGHFICLDYHISKTERNVITCLGEHNSLTHDSKPLQNHNLNHSFNWFITANASRNKQTRTNREQFIKPQ